MGQLCLQPLCKQAKSVCALTKVTAVLPPPSRRLCLDRVTPLKDGMHIRSFPKSHWILWDDTGGLQKGRLRVGVEAGAEGNKQCFG